MAGAGYKTFTAGEVLTASDVNTFLMQQSVQNYGGTAARSSAIPSPSTGMVSYIGTTGTATIPQLEVYTGSAWQQPYGLTLIAKADFTTATSVTIDNCFTSTYQDYCIIIDLSTQSLTENGTLKLRAGGSTPALTAYYYTHLYMAVGSTAINGVQGSGVAGFLDISRADSGNSGFAQITISKPQEAIRTNLQAFISDSSIWRMYGGLLANTNQYDGFVWSPNAGTATGTIRVYGLRKS